MPPKLPALCLLRLCAAAVCLLLIPPAFAAELKPETAAAWDRYLRATEAALDRERINGPFLFIDSWPAERRRRAYQQLREGEILIEQAATEPDGEPIKVPSGMIHDWIGIAFIPGATLDQTLAIANDYSAHEKYYFPDVRQSRETGRDGRIRQVFLQMYKKTLVTVVFNANFDIVLDRLGPGRAESRVYSTRLAEVADYGEPGERELPVDGGHGYLWRMFSCWRYEERDGGVYVQLQTIGLSRDIPFLLRWLIRPLVRSIPRGALQSTLSKTRAAVTGTPATAVRPAFAPTVLAQVARERAPLTGKSRNTARRTN